MDLNWPIQRWIKLFTNHNFVVVFANSKNVQQSNHELITFKWSKFISVNIDMLNQCWTEDGFDKGYEVLAYLAFGIATPWCVHLIDDLIIINYYKVLFLL